MSGKDLWFIACLVLMLVVGTGSHLIWHRNIVITQAVEVGVAAVWLFGVPRMFPRVKRFIRE